MTSDRQIDANRRNALKSTGPRTPEGKDAVRLNALKHGLLSREILLPGEDEEALRELDEYLRAELQPVGELENLLIDRVVAAYWRLRRLGRVEAGIFIQESYGSVGDSDASKLGLSFIRDGNGANAFSKLSRYEAGIERGLYKALHELQRLQAARRADGSALPPVAIDVESPAFLGMSIRASCHWSRDAAISNAPALPLLTTSTRAHRPWARETRPPAVID